MKFILYHWNTLSMDDLENGLIKIGHEVDCINYVFSDFDKDDVFEERMNRLLQKKRYDAVISFDFFQIISRVCNEHSIPYISWVWDSPQINLYSKEVFNACNYIFLFDKEAYEELTEIGVKTMYYLPLAVNVDRLEKILITDEDKAEYATDVSFVGSLYDKTNLYDEMIHLPNELKLYFNEIMEQQSKCIGCNIIDEGLTDEKLIELQQYVSIKMGENYLGTIRNIVLNRVLAAKVTNIERNRLVSKLAHKFNFILYTGSDTSNIPEVKNKGYVNYFSTMPKVFKQSKINLNMTLRTIKTGIPLRVFDVLGAGGFLITNYQEDLDKFFIEGEDLVYYRTEEELFDLIDYYLIHDEEREQIARNGHMKVKQFHNYDVRLRYILDIVFDNYSNCDYMGNTRTRTQTSNGSIILSDSTRLNKEIWENLNSNNILEANNLFQLYYRNHIELTEEEKILKLVYQSILNICIREFQLEGQYSLLLKYQGDKEAIQCNIERVIYLLKDVNSTKMDEAIDELFSMLNLGNVTCLELIEIILLSVEQKVKIFNILASKMIANENYDKVLPFLIEAEEIDPTDRETICNLVTILSYMGEKELAKEYECKLNE